jgi:hypothetical protein
MGASLSQDYGQHLEAYRGTVVEMVDSALEATPLDPAHPDYVCLATGRNQVEQLPEFMVLALAKVWYPECRALWHDVLEQGMAPPEFLERFRHIKLELPGCGSTESIYNVAVSVDPDTQVRLMGLWSAGMGHLRDAGIPEA